MPRVRIRRTRRGPNLRSMYWSDDPAKMMMRAMQEYPTYAEAAKALGISQATFYRYIKRYNIHPIWDENEQKLIFGN